MKKLLLLSIGILLLASCDKEQGCSVCTTSISGMETTAHQADWEASSSGECAKSQADFKGYLEGIAEGATSGTGLNYTVTCSYE